MFNNREEEAKREKDCERIAKYAFLVAAIKGRDQPGPSHPRPGLKTAPPPPGPCFQCNQSRHWAKECLNPQPQKHAQSVVNGDTGRWTVPRDALAPLGRSPLPRPGEWNVHRNALAPLERSSLLPRTPAQPYKSCSNDGTRVPAPRPMSWTQAQNLGVDCVAARKKTSFIVDTGDAFSLLTSCSGPTQESELTIKGGL